MRGIDQMQAIVDWWSTISWADFAVGSVVAALITGGFSIWAHRYDKGAALEKLDKEHEHQVSENDKAHQREIEKLRLQASDAEKEAFIQLLTSFLSHAYRYHDLNSETFNAAMEFYKLFQQYGADENGRLVLDEQGMEAANEQGKYQFYADIMTSGSAKMATVHKELSEIINQISAQSSQWGEVAKVTRFDICEVAYPNSHDPKAKFTHPDQGQKAIDAFQAMLDAAKKTPPGGSVFVPPQ